MHGKRLQEPHTQGVDIRLLLMKFHVEALPGMGVTALDLACLDSLEFGKLAQSRVLCAARHLYGAFVAAAAPPVGGVGLVLTAIPLVLTCLSP